MIFKKSGCLSEKLKTLTSPQLPESLIFFAEILDTFPTQQCVQKGTQDFFTSFRSCVINKNFKHDCVETRYFFIFANNARSKQNKKKFRTPFCRHW